MKASARPLLTLGMTIESPHKPYNGDDAETTLLPRAQRTASVRLGPVGPPPPPPHWVGQHTLAMEAEGTLSAEELDVMDADGHWAHQDAPPPPRHEKGHMASTGRRLLRHAPETKTTVHPAPLEYHLSRINAPMLKGFEDVVRDAPSPPPAMPPAPYAYRIGGSGIGGYKALALKDDGETLTSQQLVVGPNSLFITVRTARSLRPSHAVRHTVGYTGRHFQLHRTRR
jgi:hypothetical protein